MSKIISAFPGMGKSHLTKKFPEACSDSDSSEFSWSSPGVRNPSFPENYIEHIKKMLEEKEYVFVSTHKEVREALVKEKLHFYLMYPDPTLKEVFLKRYEKRGSDQKFIEMMDSNWDKFIDDCGEQENCQHVIMDNEIPFVYMLKGISE